MTDLMLGPVASSPKENIQEHILLATLRKCKPRGGAYYLGNSCLIMTIK